MTPKLPNALRGELPSHVLSSALAMLLLFARMVATHDRAYSFLAWNLFLAWVPYVCASSARVLHVRPFALMHRGRTLLLVVAFATWLGFLPNAPYLVTDFIHLYNHHDGAPLWFDAVMLVSFAWAGVGLGVTSLRVWVRILAVRAGNGVLAVFVGLTALLTGFGIYLGRFARLNTWDVATHPHEVISNVLSPLAHPFSQHQPWTVSLTFAFFFLVTAVIDLVRASHRSDATVASRTGVTTESCAR